MMATRILAAVAAMSAAAPARKRSHCRDTIRLATARKSLKQWRVIDDTERLRRKGAGRLRRA